MVKSRFTGWLVAFAFCFVLPWNAAARRQAATDVKISYLFPQQRMSLNQPVVVTFAVKNESPQTIKLDLGQNRKGGFAFELVPPDGVKIRLPQYSRDGISRLGTLAVRPGQDFSEKLILNEWYPFRKPGSYVLKAHLTQPILFEDGSSAAINTGSSGTIEIGPRNIAQLESVCRKLSEQIEDSTSAEDSLEAAFELGYVTDATAVPYLQRAFVTRKLTRPIVIDGLERIGNDTAARVLISFLKTENGDTAALIRGALERIRKETPHPVLRQEIQRALIHPIPPAPGFDHGLARRATRGYAASSCGDCSADS